MREIFEFKNQVDDDCISISSHEDFTSLDDCIDQSRQTETFSIASLFRCHQHEPKCAVDAVADHCR